MIFIEKNIVLSTKKRGRKTETEGSNVISWVLEKYDSCTTFGQLNVRSDSEEPNFMESSYVFSLIA